MFRRGFRGSFWDTWRAPKGSEGGLSGWHVPKGFPKGVFRRGFHRWIRDQWLGFIYEIGPRRVEIGPAERPMDFWPLDLTWTVVP